MNENQDDIEKYLKKIGFSPDIFDRLRVRQLESLKTAQKTKMQVYKKERERLAAKYGAQHPRVRKLDIRLKSSDNIIRGFDMEIESSGIKFPDFDKKTSSMVCGRVFDKEVKGIKGLTISLCDRQGRWIEETGYTGTDKSGFFALIFSPGKSGETKVQGDQELFLTVSDKQKNILHRESEPIPIKIGQVIPRFIVISDLQGAYTPPGPGQGKPGPGQDQEEPEQKQTGPTPGKDQWIVEGKITDENNKAIKGVKVNLYDTKHRFDDRLGSKVADRYGKFRFIFKGETFQALMETKADIHLDVVDDKGKKVYTSPEPVRCEPGHVDVFDIQIPPRS